ncbi:phosphatase [Marinactinospora thermotolerans]|uniref:Uncharacterized protein n=1 Tax=Marinactinospora thermotolerans DSM 45154 TaxID=1122192 RepID=A0A1T4N7C7_9ACTN|nr:hypothetical protein [Marinactinospora thermotolerans]SJZ75083.1 hypothetical protein SAMN02745673_01308 [Marinactinospora thermotolerans DSM 45154]
MPIRPSHLATMSAAIAGAVPPRAGRGPVTVTYASGHRQVVERVGRTPLDPTQGGVVALDAGAGTRFSLFASGERELASGDAPMTFDAPLPANSIILS